MTEPKLYILSFDAKFTLSNAVRHPAKFLIKLGTWSNINHVADVYNYKGWGRLINQAMVSNYQSIDFIQCLSGSDSTIRAYELKVAIDFEKWNNDTKSLKGRRYDFKGAAYSAVDKIPILREIFKQDPGDTEVFCTEAVIEKLQNQGYLHHIKNKNTDNPKEFIKHILSLCKPPIVVWKDKKLIHDIWAQ